MANFIPSLFDDLKPIFLTYNATIVQNVHSFINEWENNLDFFNTQTSGSTGTPKTIQIKKIYAEHSAQNTINALNLRNNTKALLCINTSTIGGKMMIVRSLIGNMQLYVSDVTSNPLLTLKESIDFIAVVPLQLAKMLEESIDQLKRITTIIVGGGSISVTIEKQLIDNHLTVYQTFGMTETISHIAFRKVGYKGNKTYKTLPGITVSAENDQLIIHAPQLGIESLTTSDLVTILSPTEFEWHGRNDFVINTGGVKLITEQLESEIAQLIPSTFFIAPQHDELFGQKVVLLIEGEMQDELLNKSFYASLSPYSIPKEVCFITAFIRTDSGKIDRIKTMEKANGSTFRKIL